MLECCKCFRESVKEKEIGALFQSMIDMKIAITGTSGEYILPTHISTNGVQAGVIVLIWKCLFPLSLMLDR